MNSRANSTLPKMSDELKKNLNKHFGLNINSLKNFNIGSESVHQLISNPNLLGGLISHIDATGT